MLAWSTVIHTASHLVVTYVVRSHDASREGLGLLGSGAGVVSIIPVGRHHHILLVSQGAVPVESWFALSSNYSVDTLAKPFVCGSCLSSWNLQQCLPTRYDTPTRAALDCVPSRTVLYIGDAEHTQVRGPSHEAWRKSEPCCQVVNEQKVLELGLTKLIYPSPGCPDWAELRKQAMLVQLPLQRRPSSTHPGRPRTLSCIKERI
ncbi:uncharacterized protein B0I36DRAFT_310863 [Microdochium trichocladiopsis]|uniref:Uncharacterized protein n=1 Tax=Microdochium trichocladiopsis TaxID=1682393 RepID=A0A9P9BWE3_9PEZI|nr:uncharacterized protein B0I36DRAFT_310863 [Microdochium trichocladiopsis]KAH7040515.1 hypothetical protein B0I36DRAFT_310863 [Microdochium trichocladiopsis]